MKSNYTPPILLICFNRASHVSQVLEKVVEAKPRDLYIFRDHWRENRLGEQEKCEEVLNMVKAMTNGTGINIHYFLPDYNLGCGRGPMSAITWFFENVEQGIILEDDCVPHNDFFLYCADLLEKYRDDNRIGFIGGCNYQDGRQRGDGSYYFSMGHHGTWGWASWRRSWSRFDYYMDSMSMKEFSAIIRYYGRELRFTEYWEDIFTQIKKDRMRDSAWDYQFYFLCWKNHQLAIIPNVNLVSNIGDGVDATHTGASSSLLNTNTGSILPLKHPTVVEQNKDADMYFHRKYVQSYNYGWNGFKRFPYRLNKRLKKMLGHQGPWLKRK